jgi:thymidine phosphorylase
VPSPPLITASIMSKKLALGAAILVLDVKWGRGAFLGTPAEARELAAALCAVARSQGVSARALITDMNQPLGRALGTAVEVRAARMVLAGGGSRRLREITLALARAALEIRGWSGDEAAAVLGSALRDGRALAAWDRIVEAHGGDPDPDRLARPVDSVEVSAERAGFVTGIAASELGWVAVDLGAGRRRRDETLAHGSGLEVGVRIGDSVQAGQNLATLLVGEREADVAALIERTRSAFEIGEGPPAPSELILETIGESAPG